MEERQGAPRRRLGITRVSAASLVQPLARLTGLIVVGLALVAPARAEEVKPAVPCGVKAAVFRAGAPLAALSRALNEGRPARILAIGSSSTEGVGASEPGLAYPARLEAELRSAWPGQPVSVRNAGIGGETAPQTLARLRSLLDEERPDLVIWQVGTNDAVRGEDELGFRARLVEGLDAIRAAGAAALLLDQQFYPAIREPARYERFVEAVGAVGAERRVGVFSRYALMRAWGERSREELTSSLAGDGFHMADRGYACLANLLAGSLVQTVKAAPAIVAAAARRWSRPAMVTLR